MHGTPKKQIYFNDFYFHPCNWGCSGNGSPQRPCRKDAEPCRKSGQLSRQAPGAPRPFVATATLGRRPRPHWACSAARRGPGRPLNQGPGLEGPGDAAPPPPTRPQPHFVLPAALGAPGARPVQRAASHSPPHPLPRFCSTGSQRSSALTAENVAQPAAQVLRLRQKPGGFAGLGKRPLRPPGSHPPPQMPAPGATCACFSRRPWAGLGQNCRTQRRWAT